MIRKLLMAAAGIFVATQVQAATVTIDFEGTVDRFVQSGLGSERLVNSLEFGDRYTASFTFDSEATGFIIFRAGQLNYAFQSFNMTLANGETLDFSNAPAGGNSRTGYLRLSEDGVALTSTGNSSIGVEYAALLLFGRDAPLLGGAALADLITYAEGQDLSGAVFRRNLRVRLSETDRDTSNPLARCTGSCTVEFSVQELSLREDVVAPVPLPAAGWLLIASLGGLGAMRRFRI